MPQQPIVLLAAVLSLLGPTAVTGGSEAPCPLAAMRVAVAADASASELGAAEELALWVGRVAGTAGPLAVVQLAVLRPGQPHFAVGVGAALAAGVAPGQLSIAALGDEGFVASSRPTPGAVVLSGAANAVSPQAIRH